MKSVGAILALCYFYTVVGAAPCPLPSSKKQACDKITKYNVDWFIETGRKPKPASCLFYTRGLSKKAREYAKTEALTTIWVCASVAV